MKVGTRVLLVHAVSGVKEALQVVWVAGTRWNARRIPESKLGEAYLTWEVPE